MQAIHERIHPRWTAFLAELGRLDRRFQDPQLQSELLIVVDPRGVIERSEYTRHAPLKGFDDAPADLVRDLGLLPAPPPALQSDDGLVYLRFRFSRQQPGCEDHAVIERRMLLPSAVPRLIRAGRAAEVARRIREEEKVEDRPALLRLFAIELGKSAALAKDPSQREWAAAILGHLPDAKASLIALLQDAASPVRLRTLEALSGKDLDPSFAPALRKLLATEDRALAALFLARMGDKVAVPVLREALSAGQRPADSAAALKSLGDGAFAGQLVAQMLDRHDRRLAGTVAARALGDPALAPALLKNFALGQEVLRLAVLDAIGAMGARAPGDARKALLRSMADLSSKVRARAMLASGLLDDHSHGLRYRLTDALSDPEPQVRAAAATALVRVGGEQSRDELLHVVKDKSVQVRAALLQAAQAHPYASSGTLVSRLRSDSAIEEAARKPPHFEDPLTMDEGASPPATAMGTPPRPMLLTSRAVEMPSVAGEEERLADQLLSPADEIARLHAAAAYLALER